MIVNLNKILKLAAGIPGTADRIAAVKKRIEIIIERSLGVNLKTDFNQYEGGHPVGVTDVYIVDDYSGEIPPLITEIYLSVEGETFDNDTLDQIRFPVSLLETLGIQDYRKLSGVGSIDYSNYNKIIKGPLEIFEKEETITKPQHDLLLRALDYPDWVACEVVIEFNEGTEKDIATNLWNSFIKEINNELAEYAQDPETIVWYHAEPLRMINHAFSGSVVSDILVKRGTFVSRRV